MKLRIKDSLGQQIGVDCAHAVTRHLSIQKGSAAFALGTRRCLERQGIGFSTFYRNSRRWVQAAWIGLPMHGLAVVTMTEILHHWLASKLHLHSTARTLKRGKPHGFPWYAGADPKVCRRNVSDFRSICMRASESSS